MQRFVFGALALALCIAVPSAHAQLKKLDTKGWGSLSGQVKYDGDPLPPPVDLTGLMKKHNDKECCLDPKAKEIEKLDHKWLVDPKTRGVANVMIWIKPPEGTFLPVHKNLEKLPDCVIDQPHCAFLPHVAGFVPKRFDDTGKLVETGQKLILRNSAKVPHNVRAIPHPIINARKEFNINIPPKTDIDTKTFNPQPIPVTLQCDFHPWMSARLFVFDQPYFAVTDNEGRFEIPVLPAGTKIFVAAYHEDIGYIFGKQGQAFEVKEGKNVLDFTVKKAN